MVGRWWGEESRRNHWNHGLHCILAGLSQMVTLRETSQAQKDESVSRILSYDAANDELNPKIVCHIIRSTLFIG